MQVLKQIFNFYINSSIHVALAVVSLTWITLKEYNISGNDGLLCFVFFASISGYNFVKYFGIAKFHHIRLATWLQIIQIFSFISFVLMCYYGLSLNPETLLYLAVFALITFFYAMPLIPVSLFFTYRANLRSVSGLKVYVIALVWAGVTVFLPIINNEYQLSVDIFITATQRFIFIIILMLPFEIRDLRFDSLKLATIPQKIGVIQTKMLGTLFLFAFFLLEFFKDSVNSAQLLILFLISGITLLFLLFSSKEQGRYYSSFWVEGLPILWGLLVFLFN
ncbi:hypothetical protein [Mariniflexile sp.]|uniref:hypothetical protein n=1 Tax=Mariniflexile sp. TaxID=1979402 RepID=UPI00356A3389